MNYGKRGAAKKKKALRSKSKKWSKRFALTFFKTILLVILAAGIIGIDVYKRQGQGHVWDLSYLYFNCKKALCHWTLFCLCPYLGQIKIMSHFQTD